MHINAKIASDRLLVRVGGGFMTADEFIANHGNLEMAKLHHDEDNYNTPKRSGKKSHKKTRSF